MKYAIAMLTALIALILSDAAAAKLPCLTKSQAMARGDSPSYRKVPGLGRCWYVGERTPKKSGFVPQKTSLKKPMKSRVSSISEPEKTDLDVKAIRGGPAPEQARLERAFDALAAPSWRGQIEAQVLFGILRLDYAERWPTWEMASRFHGD